MLTQFKNFIVWNNDGLKGLKFVLRKMSKAEIIRDKILYSSGLEPIYFGDKAKLERSHKIFNRRQKH